MKMTVVQKANFIKLDTHTHKKKVGATGPAVISETIYIFRHILHCLWNMEFPKFILPLGILKRGHV